MIPQKRNIFCIIVHFGSYKPTNVLISQLQSGDIIPQHIIVVNNDAEKAYTHPGVSVVQNKQNQGYAGGINAGMEMLRTLNVQPQDTVVCMNNDITVASHTLQDMLHSIAKDTIASHHVWGINLCTGRTIQADFSLKHPWYVLPYVHGSFLAAEYATWKRVIPLSDTYFMYWEDVLLSIRAKHQGVVFMALEKIGISHRDELHPLSAEQEYYLVRNGAAFLRTYTPGLWRWYWRLLHRLRLVYHYAISKKPNVLRALQESKNICNE